MRALSYEAKEKQLKRIEEEMQIVGRHAAHHKLPEERTPEERANKRQFERLAKKAKRMRQWLRERKRW